MVLELWCFEDLEEKDRRGGISRDPGIQDPPPPPPPYTLLDQQLASKGPFWSNFTLNGQQKREKEGALIISP